IGNNWAGFDIIFSPGDFSGDGKPDVLARNSATTDLQLYKGNGAGGFQAGTGGVIGNNWSGFSAIFSPGDFSGDGRPDVLARNSATTDLQLYKGNGAGGFQTGTGSVISNNWSGFNIIF
ncbi:VCBS repeat-containing protein, partial [Micromonospora sediminicola]